jgi:dTDP-4-dehydrorhamnose 3,5-epimerase
VSTVQETKLPGVLLVETRVFRDERGWFREIWRSDQFVEAGGPSAFVQDNVSVSSERVLRGLHLQSPRGQGKLVSVLAGEVFDVAVDVRVDSPSFGQWVGEALSAENARQMYIPPGFAHGFVVVSDLAVVSYKCTEYYRPATELSLRWDDPRLGIAWPVPDPVLSDKDRNAPTLDMLPFDRLPTCESS